MILQLEEHLLHVGELQLALVVLLERVQLAKSPSPSEGFLLF
jgi:hypothetical protein